MEGCDIVWTITSSAMKFPMKFCRAKGLWKMFSRITFRRVTQIINRATCWGMWQCLDNNEFSHKIASESLHGQKASERCYRYSFSCMSPKSPIEQQYLWQTENAIMTPLRRKTIDSRPCTGWQRYAWKNRPLRGHKHFDPLLKEWRQWPSGAWQNQCTMVGAIFRRCQIVHIWG